MSAVIFATDPTGNNNPFLKIVSPALFVVSKGETYSGSTWTGPAQIYTSIDAINWTLATTPLDGFTQLSLAGAGFTPSIAPNILYYNGLWLGAYAFDGGTNQYFNGVLELVSAFIHSYDGTNWTLDWKPTNIAGGFWYMTITGGQAVLVATQNGFVLTNQPFVPPQNVITIPVLCQASAKPVPPPFTFFGDEGFFGNEVLVDPSQGAGNLTFGGSDGSYATNPLISATAVRFTGGISGTLRIEYTSTPITQTIVNGNFAAASWTTSFNQSAYAGNWTYGLPTGAL